MLDLDGPQKSDAKNNIITSSLFQVSLFDSNFLKDIYGNLKW